jgi:hypothetical protein
MTEYGSKSVAVVDNGLFLELSRTLAASFGKVYYTSNWVASFPKSSHYELGEGYAEIERVDDIWDIVNDVDLFVFPDIYQGNLQRYLVDQGKRVFGSRNGDEIETLRIDAKTHFQSLGIPVAPYEVVTGLENLRKYIKSRGDEKLWVKIELTRGDTETFCSEGYDYIKNKLDELAGRLGPTAEKMDFLVEDHISDSIELAIDTFCIDGQYPNLGQLGLEKKDEGYACVVKPWKEQPEALRDVYEKIAPTMKEYQFRNFFSLECPIREKDIWIGDPCCRCGSPLMELQMRMIDNIPEILWEGADGNLVEPKYNSRFGFETVIESCWAKDHPLLLKFPDKYRDQIKLHYAAEYEDGTWILPQNEDVSVGAIVACGDSLEECFEEVKEIAGEVKGIQVETYGRCIDGITKSIEELGQWGVRF